MTKLLKALLPALLLVGLFLGSGVRPAAAQTGGLPTIKQPASARFDISGTITVNGQTLTIGGTGATSGSDSQVDVSVGTPSGPVTTSVITKAGKLYTKSGNGSWQVINIGAAGMGSIPGLGNIPGTGGLGTGMPDLNAIQAALHIGPAIPDTVNGVAASRYDADVDVEKLLAAAGQSTADPQTAAIYNSIQMKLSLWVGSSDQYLHKLTLMITANVPNQPQPITLNLNYVMSFHDFNTPVTITAPVNAVPLDLGNTPGMIPGGSMGNMGGGSTVPAVGPLPGMPRTGAGTPALLPLLVGLALTCLALGGYLRRRPALT